MEGELHSVSEVPEKMYFAWHCPDLPADGKSLGNGHIRVITVLHAVPSIILDGNWSFGPAMKRQDTEPVACGITAGH